MTQPSIISLITNDWQSREQIEWKARRPAATELMLLTAEGKILSFVDASQKPWVTKYCLPHDVSDLIIPRSGPARRCAGCPVMEAAE